MLKSNNKKMFIVGAAAILLAGTGALHAQGTLFVENNSVGILQPNPTHPLHITANSGGALEVATFENTGGAFFVLRDFSVPRSWAVALTSGLLALDDQQSPNFEFLIDSAGNVTVEGVLVHSSSREVKHDIQPVTERDILDTVVNLPVARWSYNADAPGIRHMGPMAEDFYEAFGLGFDDRHMASSDSAGVALAAIKGLHEVVQEKEATIQELMRRLEALEQRLGVAQ